MSTSFPPLFASLEVRLADIKARFQRGEIDSHAFQAEVQELKLVDGLGKTWWLGGEEGAWHIWDGSAWVRSTPPVSSGPGENRTGSNAGRSGRPFLIGCGLGTLMVSVLIGVFLTVGWQAYQQEPMIVEGVEGEFPSTPLSALSSAQLEVIDRLGYPEAFSILFFEEQQAGGTLIDVRFESWTYYTAGREITFINGELDGEELTDFDIQGEILPIPHQPEQFVAYMSLDEVIASAGLETYMVIPLEKEFVEGGEVYYANELTFGLKENELLYVEALAMEAEG